MIPANAEIYAIFNVTNTYTAFFLELLSDEVYLHTGIAVVEAILDQIRRPGLKLSENVLQHMGKGLNNLRHKIEKPGAIADDITIMAMLFLACTSVCHTDTILSLTAELRTDVPRCLLET
jgi:hypothetical protein